MKKIILICLCTVLFIACKSDDDNDNAANCITLSNNVSAASEIFFNNPTTTEPCNDYKTALQNLLDSGCVSEEEAVQFRQQLETLGDCASL